MIQSMTAYARCTVESQWGIATWEIRSINHRYLDCVIKVPEGWRQLESAIRQELQQSLQRGRVECSLRYQPSATQSSQLVINTELLQNIAMSIKELDGCFATVGEIDPMRLLAWPQVVKTVEEDITVSQAAVMHLFSETLNELIVSRQREGAALKLVLEQKLMVILELVAKLKVRTPIVLQQQRAKFLAYFAEIQSRLDSSRLEQELVFFAQKIDITEEIDRLATHVHEIQRTLNQETAAGKRLDFLSQELNREANTIASKSLDSETTMLAVELKVIIEQIREQVQNLA